MKCREKSQDEVIRSSWRWFVIGAMLAIGGCSKSSTPQNSASNPGNTAGENAPAAGAPAANSAPNQPAPPPAAPPVVIDAGTLLTVTLDQGVSSKTHNKGDTFTASLAAPDPRGRRGGVAAGDAGEGYCVASGFGRPSESRRGSCADAGLAYGERAARFDFNVGIRGDDQGARQADGNWGGGGAAFGAIVGGLAGGGKGAATGLLAVGGAGTAGTAFTGKRDINIPAETRLHFKLTAPLTVQPPTSTQ